MKAPELPSAMQATRPCSSTISVSSRHRPEPPSFGWSRTGPIGLPDKSHQPQEADVLRLQTFLSAISGVQPRLSAAPSCPDSWETIPMTLAPCSWAPGARGFSSNSPVGVPSRRQGAASQPHVTKPNFSHDSGRLPALPMPTLDGSSMPRMQESP